MCTHTPTQPHLDYAKSGCGEKERTTINTENAFTQKELAIDTNTCTGYCAERERNERRDAAERERERIKDFHFCNCVVVVVAVEVAEGVLLLQGSVDISLSHIQTMACLDAHTHTHLLQTRG